MQQGPFAPRALPRFLATTSLAAAVSSSADFPGGPVIRLTCSTDGSVGRGRFHKWSDMPLSPCCPYPPRRGDMSRQSVCATPCSLRPTIEGSASGQIFFRGHHWVHVCCGPVTRSPSHGRLCRLASSASFPPRMQPKLRGFQLLPRRDCLPLNMPAFSGSPSVHQIGACPLGGAARFIDGAGRSCFAGAG